MERQGGIHRIRQDSHFSRVPTPIRVVCLAYLSLQFFSFLEIASSGLEAAETGSSERRTPRTVTVRISAEGSLKQNEFWMVDITRVVMRVSQVFRKEFGIKFKITAYDYWDLEPASRAGDLAGSMNPESLRSILPTLRERLRQAESRNGGADDRTPLGGPPVACDILIGLIPEGTDGPVSPGVADYLNGIVILRYLKKKGGLVYVLLHELCHIFGAIDLREKGKVMSWQRPTFRISSFTKAIVLANRERAFRPGECPLDEERRGEAIALYEERQALGLEEDELTICLHYLQDLLKKKKRFPV